VVVHAFEAVTFFGNASTLAVLGLAVAFVLCALRRWSLLSGWAAGDRRHRAAEYDPKRGCSTPASPAARAVGHHRSGLEFSERPCDGFLGRLWVCGLSDNPYVFGPFPALEGDCATCNPRFADRVQPSLLGRSFPERRYRRVRGGSRLAHVLHPNHPSDARPGARIPNPTWPQARAGNTFPNTTTADEGISKPEAANVLSSLFRPTSVNSATCNDGCVAIDAYPEMVNDRSRGPEFRVVKSGHVRLFIDQNITCAAERVVVGQNSLESLGVPLHPSLRHVVLQLEQRLNIILLASLSC
jgi:hypothetical protein